MLRRLLARFTPLTLAVVIAAATTIVGVSYAGTAAAGADAAGYASQAERWIAGDVRVDQSWASPAPWPWARWTFAPLGYRPSSVAGDEWWLVPVYPPGFPLILALAKLIGGQEAMFWVVPMAGAVLVLVTFGIGRKLATPGAALIGTWLVATSPAVLFVLVTLMTDVPVAAAWAGAFYLLLNRRPAGALAAGAIVGFAIVIRPNLAPLAAIFGLWYLVPLLRRGTFDRRGALVQGVLYAAGAAAGAIFIAMFNQTLNGSPWLTGYGPMAGALSLDHFWPNAARYSAWLIESHTPIVLVGLAALAVPLRRLWPAAEDRLAFTVAGLFVISLWLLYGFYLVFDAWWYLRFLLPTWPFLMLGVGAVLSAIARRGGRVATACVVVGVVALGVYQVTMAADRHVFGLWQDERRYVSVAREVRRLTDRTSAIVSMQHSSSVRYYGGRVSVRYDAMEDDWLDRTIDWLSERGIRSYALLDDWEIPRFRSQFAGQRTVTRLDDAPLLHYHGASQVYLFDLSSPRDPAVPTITIVDTYEGTRSVEPVSLPPLDLTSR